MEHQSKEDTLAAQQPESYGDHAGNARSPSAMIELIRVAYADIIRPAAPELAETTKTLAQFVNLILYPVKTALWAHRVIDENIIPALAEKMRNIPKHRFIPPKLHIIGPALVNYTYAADEPTLSQMFATLISRSMDSDFAEDVLPSFSHLIQLLSPDEAIALRYLSQHHVTCTSVQDWDYKTHRPASERTITNISFPTDQLVFPARFEMYMMHLKSLDLVFWQTYQGTVTKLEDRCQKEETPGAIAITDFGRLFVRACIPGEDSSTQESQEQRIVREFE